MKGREARDREPGSAKSIWVPDLASTLRGLNTEEVFEEFESGARQHRFRMELHAFDAQFAIPQAHEQPAEVNHRGSRWANIPTSVLKSTDANNEGS